MNELILINGLTFADHLDRDKDMEINLKGHDVWINQTEAEAIIEHLTEVFGL